MGKQLISPGAAYLVLDILKDVRRPGLEGNWRAYPSSSPLAWKTGTSYGSRDAWAVGVSPQWTIAVWVGNFSGGSVSGLTGVDSAGPLLFQVFNRLPKDPYGLWFARPEADLVEVSVSPATGYRLQGVAQNTARAQAPASAKPLRYSPYERTLFVTGDERMMVCSLCWDRQDVKTIQKVVYPLRSRATWAVRLGSTSLPPHNPDCPALAGKTPSASRIPNPPACFSSRGADGYQYQQIKLEALHASQGKGLFWYLDGTYSARPGASTIRQCPWNRAHILYLVDEDGYAKTVSFRTERR